MRAEHAELVLHFERGRLGAGAYPGKDAVDPHHTDVAVFGALQVSASGDLARSASSGTGVVDDDLEGLDFEGGRVVVMMEHTDWRGQSRIVARCALPVIGVACVDRIITDLAIIEFEQKPDRPRSLVLRELAPGVSISEVVEATGAPLRIPPELVRPGSTL
ncbi:MAG: succinyl-CoA--3-ketoacid-CoA transferase [Frankiales bacterium]|nr:succinyl-CoA--3-ketoacid-CoA transferase [Frankiales bacterium]